MSLESVPYRVVSMPGDGGYIFHSLCTKLQSQFRLIIDIWENMCVMYWNMGTGSRCGLMTVQGIIILQRANIGLDRVSPSPMSELVMVKIANHNNTLKKKVFRFVVQCYQVIPSKCY